MVVRCLCRIPALTRRTNRQCRALSLAFQATIEPVLDTAISDAGLRRELADQLLPWGIRGGTLVESYAELSGQEPNPRLAVLAGVFARIYDDLLDEASDGTVIGRLDALFAGAPMAPATDLEVILEALYHQLTGLADRPRHETTYRALTALHQLQIASLRQADGTMSAAEVWEITLAKGGLGMLVLGSLTHPGVSADEQLALHRIGRLLQLIDDYEDETTDRQHGLHTAATTTTLTSRQLRADLGALETQLRCLYGDRRALRFLDSLYFWLYAVLFTRVIARDRPPGRRSGAVPQRLPLRVLLRRRTVLR